ncbi:hypothetical protein [Acetobacter papayae]
MIDLLLRNATLPDSTPADIAIHDGKFVSVGKGFTGDAAQMLDLGGHLVCPPFVDSHFHLDSTLTSGWCDTTPAAPCWKAYKSGRKRKHS